VNMEIIIRHRGNVTMYFACSNVFIICISIDLTSRIDRKMKSLLIF
jgi:hypothetical protein